MYRFKLTWAESSIELFWLPVVRNPPVGLNVGLFHTFIFYSRNAEPNLIKLDTEHHWGNGIQNCSNKGSKLRLYSNTLTSLKYSFFNFYMNFGLVGVGSQFTSLESINFLSTSLPVDKYILVAISIALIIRWLIMSQNKSNFHTEIYRYIIVNLDELTQRIKIPRSQKNAG